MLEVTVIRKVDKPHYQIFESTVILSGYDRLTPQAARAALEIAFGQPYGGTVCDGNGLGYRVYPNSYRKLVTPIEYHNR